MIRMGRSSKTDSSSDSSQNYEQPKSSYSYQPQETAPSRSSSSVMTDSESMARDIKEGRLSGFVGYGTVLTGETSFQAMLRIDGHLTGRVSSENGTLIVGASGRVDANIAVASAVVSGTINGDIVATEKLELTRSARVIGNIQTPRLVIEDGASFEGGCTMLKAKESLDKRKPKTEYPVIETTTELSKAEETETEEAKKAPKISFGFTGKEDKLKKVLIELCNKVELLNEDKTNTTELLSLLMSKDIKSGITPIYLNCETVQFRYIVDKLKNHFSNLTPTEIEKSECFYSKKSNLIKAQNLYSNKIGAPKDQSTIDNIINQLQ